MNGEVRVVPDVPGAFAAIVEEVFATRSAHLPFRIGASAGASGRACFEALARSERIDFSSTEVYFVDERCVDPESADSNQFVIGKALAPRRAELAGFSPMSCANGPRAYEAKLRAAGQLDIIQLGLGPDGHTASLFPGSPALLVDDGRLVVTNHDILGQNDFERLTLTYAGIGLAPVVVITVIGAARAGVIGRIAKGEDLPAAAVQADRLIWLIDEDAATMLDHEPSDA
jgi:6-phosphogluconolactonase